MSINLIPFSFEGAEVRVLDQSGEPWWVLTDVCKVLEITNSRDAATRLDDDEKDDVGITDAIGREQKTTIINESGLWSLVLTSRKAAAKRFKKWITAEVIPSIRKTGGYMVTAKEETPEELALRAVTVLQATLARREEENRLEIERQKALIDEVAPKARALETLAGMRGFHTLTQTAKACSWPRDAFIEECNRTNWIYRDRAKEIWMGYSDKEKLGYLDYKPFQYTNSEGRLIKKPQVVFTDKGLAKICAIFSAKEPPRPFAKKPEEVS